MSAQRDNWQRLLPRAVTVLGELGEWLITDPTTNRFYGVDYKPNRLLCASEEGRNMYIIRPILDAGPVRSDAFALSAYDLHERFTHRAATDYYNIFCPPIRKPTFAGELVIIRYYAQKGDDEEATYEHYFDEPGEAPAYVKVFSVGHGQYFIPQGRFRVAEAGIEFFADDGEKGTES